MAGTSTCTDCPVGQFNATAGASACTNCAAGTFNASTGTSTCASCSAGRFSAAGASTCTDCPPGQFSATSGASACTSCAAGTFNAVAAATTCINCAAGRFSDTAGASSCLDCPVGSFQSAAGQSSCAACPTGEYAFTAAATHCATCDVWAGTQRVQFKKINTDVATGNDGLAISTQFMAPSGFASLDPATTGARVIVQTAHGDFVLDAALPPGLYLGTNTRGWESRNKGEKWQYKDTTADPVGGIVSMTITHPSKRGPDQVQVKVTGKNGTYIIHPGDEPVRAVINLDDSLSPQCGDSDFESGDCAFDKKQRTLTCRVKP